MYADLLPYLQELLDVVWPHVVGVRLDGEP